MAGSVTVTAYDAFGNVATGYTGAVHFSSSDARAGLPGNYAFTAADNGVHTFTNIVLKTAASESITATDTTIATITGTQAGIIVAPATASTLLVAGFPSPVIAGVAGMVTVTAYDPYGNLATGYTGIVHFTSSDLQAGLPPNYTFAATDNGVHTFSVTLKTAGAQSLTATDTQITGTQNGILVNPATASRLILAGFPSPVAAGTAGMVTLTAQDAYGNVATGYTGTVHFTSTDGRAMLPGNYTFTTGAGGDNGVHTFSATLGTVGTQALTATDTANGSLTSTQMGIVVTPGPTRMFVVAGFPSPVTAGALRAFTVTAEDAYRNLTPSYTGTITFSSSDGQAFLPGSYTFMAGDHGMQSFGGYLATADTQSITVTDSSDPTINGSQTGIVVTPGVASRIHVTTSVDGSSTVAGTPFNVTLTVQDGYGNTVTGYIGMVTFSGQDPYGASLPANYTFTPGAGGDNGVHTFAGGATLYTAGTWDVTATDTTSGITGQDLVNVTPAALDHFLVTTSVDGSSTVAGVACDVTVTAQDAYGNTVTGYSGMVHFSSQDPYGATLPADYPFTPGAGGDNGVHTFAGGATLYTAGTWDVTVADTASGQTGSDNVVVTPAPASQFMVSAPATVTAGTAFDFTVTALDPYGNTDTNYTGTVAFSTMDPAGTFAQATYTFMPSDMGTATFAMGATLNTAGTWDVTATDAASGITGAATVTVQPPGPGASGAAGKGSGVAGSEDLSPSQPPTSANRDTAEGDPSLRLVAGLGITDAANPVPGVEALAVARPHHAPLSLVETLDQLFMEEGLIG